MSEQSDTPRTEIAEGKGLNPYFEGQFDGESDELRALRLTLVRERDEARAEIERLRVALFFVIEDADVWHDVARGGQSDNITADIRALAATEPNP